MEKQVTANLLELLSELLVHDRLHVLHERAGEYGQIPPGDEITLIEVLSILLSDAIRIDTPPHSFFSTDVMQDNEGEVVQGYVNAIGEDADTVRSRYVRHGNHQFVFLANTDPRLVDGGISRIASEEDLQSQTNAIAQGEAEHREKYYAPGTLHFPGVLRAIPATRRLTDNVLLPVPPEISGRVFFELLARVTILGRVVLHPSAGDGAIGLSWSADLGGLALTVEPHIGRIRTEVQAGPLTLWTLETDVFREKFILGLLPRISGRRMFWDAALSLEAMIDEDRHARVGGSSPQAETRLIDWRFHGSLPHVNDDSPLDDLITGPEEDSLRGIISSLFSLTSQVAFGSFALHEILGHGLCALPLRPSHNLLDLVDLGDSVVDQFRNAFAEAIGDELFDLVEQTQIEPQYSDLHWAILMVSADEVREAFLAASTGFQSLSNVSPHLTLGEAATLAADLLKSVLREANNAVANPNRSNLQTKAVGIGADGDEILENLTSLEIKTLLTAVYIPKLRDLALNQIELAHLPDRLVQYTVPANADLVRETLGAGEHLALEMEPFANDLVRIQTMQYRFRFAQIDIEPGVLSDDPTINTFLNVSYRLLCHHEAIVDEASLPLEAEVIERRVAKVPIRAATAQFGMEQSHFVVLEWPIGDAEAVCIVEADVLLSRESEGRLVEEFHLGSVRHSVQVTQDMGLNRSVETNPDDPGNGHPQGFVVEHVPTSEELLKGQSPFKLHVLLEQKPFAGRYETVRVEVLGFSFLKINDGGPKPSDPEFSYRFSADLNGNVIGRSELFSGQSSSAPSAPLATHRADGSVLLRPAWDGLVTFDAHQTERADDFFDLNFSLDFQGDQFRLSKRVFRFSEGPNGVSVEGSELTRIDTSLERAADQGATHSWGIPIGLDATVHTFSDPEGTFSVLCKFGRAGFAAQAVPAELASQDVILRLESAAIHDDLDVAGEGEFKLSPGYDLELPSLSETDPPQRVHGSFEPLGGIKRDVTSGETIEINNEVSITVPASGGTVLFRCTAVEEDVFSDDRPGTVEARLPVPEEDAAQLRVTKRADREGAYSLAIALSGNLSPSVPLLKFAQLPRAVTWLHGARGLPIVLELACARCHSMVLEHRRHGDPDAAFEELEIFDGGERREFIAEPEASTQYRVTSKIFTDNGTSTALGGVLHLIIQVTQ